MFDQTPMLHCPSWRIGVVATLLAAMVLDCAAGTPVAAPWPPDLSRQLEAALADASRYSGIDAHSLKVANIELVTWMDGSLGCPEPDVMYTQSLVPGYRILIEAGGETLDYHTAVNGTLLLCTPGRALR